MNHIRQIAAALPGSGLDAMLITGRTAMLYALGFRGEGLLLLARTGGLYITDGRYIEEAREQVTGVEVTACSAGEERLARAKDFLRACSLEQVGFESGTVSADGLRALEEGLSCRLRPAQSLLDTLRLSKDEEELDAMRRAQKITDDTFQALLPVIRPGMTERQIAARLVFELLDRGGEAVSFNPTVAAGPSGSKPHARPGDRVLERGMFLTLDFGCKVEGYCSDMTRTVAVGPPTDEMRAVYAAVLEAQEAGIRAARAGVTGSGMDGAARAVLEAAGYGAFFTHNLGHCMGLENHEGPNAAPNDHRPLPAGTVISVEPGVYLPGQFGVRIEDILVLWEGGCENLTRSSKELIVL